jgi:hypothetical protein
MTFLSAAGSGSGFLSFVKNQEKRRYNSNSGDFPRFSPEFVFV